MQYELIPGVIRYLFSLALALLGCAAAANGMLWFEAV